MLLVIGGMAAGKREYVKSLGYGPGDMADAVLDESPVLYNLQDLVARAPEKAASLLPELLKKEVVICNEVGSGVIPVDKGERTSREQTGRLCILLSGEAERVVRITCGLPMILKGVSYGCIAAAARENGK